MILLPRDLNVLATDDISRVVIEHNHQIYLVEYDSVNDDGSLSVTRLGRSAEVKDKIIEGAELWCSKVLLLLDPT